MIILIAMLEAGVAVWLILSVKEHTRNIKDLNSRLGDHLEQLQQCRNGLKIINDAVQSIYAMLPTSKKED